MIFEVERQGQGFGWRLRSGFGLTVAISPPFPTKRDCLKSIDTVKAVRTIGEFDISGSETAWQWHIRTRGGDIVASSSQVFRSRQECLHSASVAAGTRRQTPIKDLT